MAKVLLFNLSILRFYGGEEDVEKTYNPPMGLLYISSSLTFHGHEVKVIDYSKIPFSREHFMTTVGEYKPDLLGISVYTENVDEAVKLCRGVKKKYPEIYTSLGGPEASLEPLYSIKDKNVDFVTKHEGESAMLELVEAIESKESVIEFEQVTGIVLKRNDGTVYESKSRRDIQNLDLLAFPLRREVEKNEYGSMLNIITSRGCPGNCIYCSATALSGARYRIRGVSQTLLEMIYLLQFFEKSGNTIYVLDDTFTAIPERVFELIEMKKKLCLDFRWRCESRVDVITEPLVKALAESNCIGVAFGVESGSQEVLDKIHKNINLEQAEYAVALMYKNGIYVSLNFMLGHYCDTPETMEMTYQLIKYMYDKYNVGIFITYNTPFPGTWQYTHMEDVKLRLIISSYSEYSCLSPSIEGEFFTVEDQVSVYNKVLPIMVNNDFGLKR